MKLEPLQPFGILARAEGPAERLDRGELLALLRAHKLVLVRGLEPLTREAFLSFAAKDPARELVQWSFGPVMELKADPATENYLFSREEVPFHWDGAFHEEPRVLVFHCVEAPNPTGGGETTFVNSEALWEEATPEQRARWKKLALTYETEKKAHYGGRITVPMVQRHPDKEATILRYAEPVGSELNPVLLEVHGLASPPEAFLEEMRNLLYEGGHLLEHRWEENDLLLADNFSLLHGRRAFSAASPRHLRRVQIR